MSEVNRKAFEILKSACAQELAEALAQAKAEGAAEERASVAGILAQLARQYRYDQEAASDADVSELWGNCAGALELAAEEVRARGEKKL